jgi:hypothetical protein
VTAQQLLLPQPPSAVAKPSVFNTQCPGEVKPRNPTATTATTASAMIFLMMVSRDHLAIVALARRGEAKRAQQKMPRRREAKKAGRNDCENPKCDDFPHDALLSPLSSLRFRRNPPSQSRAN